MKATTRKLCIGRGGTDRSRQARRAGALSALGSLLVVALASGSSFIEPTRPLTRNEQGEYSVSGAQGILRCTVLAVVDTLTPTRYQNEPARFQALLVKPLRWLKGDGPSTPMLVGVPAIGGPARQTITALAASTPTDAVLFMSKPPWLSDARKGERWDLSDLPPVSATMDWYLNNSHVSQSDGIDWSIGGRSMDSVEAQVVEYQSAVTPSALARRAEVIVLGRVVEGRKQCSADGFETYCTSFNVEQRFAGIAPDTIQVFWLMKWVPGPPRQVLFLVRCGTAYEVLGVGGEGAVEAKGDSIPAWNIRLIELRELIAAGRTGEIPPDRHEMR